MAITSIQPNIDNAKSHTPYRDAKGAVNTEKDIKPLAPKGHLVHDTVLSVPKYFCKDIAYDIKAVKNGLQGNANDHQLGRLNDVGLKVGGIGIATYLASRTTDPKVRVMEYLGLGAFLASMTIFPKAFINVPSRVLHGYSIGKEYIDDQGRKKSVFQDSNYIPFDMYRGEYPGEDLDVIGDRMGIPRDIKNRHDMIQEQMRKVATQNNTLWMLTAGFATPVMTALICCGLEKLVSPALEKIRNLNYNSKITEALKKSEKMTLNVDEIKSNKLSENVIRILNDFKGQELPKQEYDNIISLFTEELDSKASNGIVRDLADLFKKNGEEAFAIEEETSKGLINEIKSKLGNRNKATLERVFVPTKEEVDNILNKYTIVTKEDIGKIKKELLELFNKKIENEPKVSRAYLESARNNVLENVSQFIQKTPSRYVDESRIKDFENLAKIIGDFKKNSRLLDKYKSFKVEHAPETVLARYYGKFESTLLDVLGIKYKDLKEMRQSDKYTREIIEKKINELVKDDAAYEKAVSKLAKVMSEMDASLHGSTDSGSHMKDLISAIENNFNNTAKRLNQCGKFKNTINMLVKEELEDVNSLSSSLQSREGVFKMLDGMLPDKAAGKTGIENVKASASGVGSAKNDVIARIVDRYQGVENSFNRVLHTLDLYKRNIPAAEYDKLLLNMGKDTLLGASVTDHMLKLNTLNNPELYKDLMRTVWRVDDDARNINAKGHIEEATDKALSGFDDLKIGSIKERFQQYITRFRNIVGNNTIDFTKPEHILDSEALKGYSKEVKTRNATFNLIAQNPVEMIRKAADRRYGYQTWVRKAATIGGTVIGATILAQFCFGKIRNPHNMKKQVKNDVNN